MYYRASYPCDGLSALTYTKSLEHPPSLCNIRWIFILQIPSPTVKIVTCSLCLSRTHTKYARVKRVQMKKKTSILDFLIKQPDMPSQTISKIHRNAAWLHRQNSLLWLQLVCLPACVCVCARACLSGTTYEFRWMAQCLHHQTHVDVCLRFVWLDLATCWPQ